MPELPEVELGRKVAEACARGRVIVRAKCVDDRIVFDGVGPQTVARKLKGRRVEAVRRRGKHLWFELDDRPWPLFHFGMTGAFVVPGEAALQLASGPRVSAQWPPRFWKILLELDDGGRLAMTNARRLGRIRLREDPESEPPISRLGFDPYLDPVGLAEFRRRLGARRGPLKAVLLDQSFAAGVGNWIADEVLYQARLSPHRPAASLDKAEQRALHTALCKVVRKAVDVDADKSRFPRGWLFHRRWGRVEGGTTLAGEPIEHETIAGRTTAWVPKRQR